MEANVVIKNSQIQTGLLTTNANVSIENSQLKATKANLASGTSLGSNSQVDAQSFCLDSQGSYTFNGSVIIGDVTNVSEAFLKATNATYKFFTYLGVCS